MKQVRFDPKYIAFEGRDYVGKTTHSKLFAEYLKVKWVMEPNRTIPEIREIANLALTSTNICPSTRELLLLAARTQFLDGHLLAYDSIISDRSFMSGMVYCAVETGIDFETWFNVLVTFTNIPIFPGIIIYLYSDNYEKETRPESKDLYDQRDENFYRQLDYTFMDSGQYMTNKYNIKFIPVRIDKSQSIQDNQANIIESYISNVGDMN